MKPLCALLFLIGCVGCSTTSKHISPASSIDGSSGTEVLDIQIALYGIKYPIPINTLYEKLGGDNRLVWSGSKDEPRGDGTYHLYQCFRIRDLPTVDGTYSVECETREDPSNPKNPLVIRTRIYFLSLQGLFYLEDRGLEVHGN
jgi:hypothetical protein